MALYLISIVLESRSCDIKRSWDKHFIRWNHVCFFCFHWCPCYLLTVFCVLVTALLVIFIESWETLTMFLYLKAWQSFTTSLFLPLNALNSRIVKGFFFFFYIRHHKNPGLGSLLFLGGGIYRGSGKRTKSSNLVKIRYTSFNKEVHETNFYYKLKLCVLLFFALSHYLIEQDQTFKVWVI